MIQTRRRLAEEGMQVYFSFFFSVRCNVCQRRYIFRSMETSALTQHHHSYYSAAKMFIFPTNPSSLYTILSVQGLKLNMLQQKYHVIVTILRIRNLIQFLRGTIDVMWFNQDVDTNATTRITEYIQKINT